MLRANSADSMITALGAVPDITVHAESIVVLLVVVHAPIAALALISFFTGKTLARRGAVVPFAVGDPADRLALGKPVISSVAPITAIAIKASLALAALIGGHAGGLAPLHHQSRAHGRAVFARVAVCTVFASLSGLAGRTRVAALVRRVAAERAVGRAPGVALGAFVAGLARGARVWGYAAGSAVLAQRPADHQHVWVVVVGFVALFAFIAVFAHSVAYADRAGGVVWRKHSTAS